jgi:SAM-dependent methyltransferase
VRPWRPFLRMRGNEMSDILDAAPAADLSAIRRRHQAIWASGNFSVIGTTLQIVGESLAEAVDLLAGERVIDIAAGNGNATLAAARRFAQVTSTDHVQSLLDNGRERAWAEGQDVNFQLADAEQLPFPDASFDVALSTFGVMFTLDHGRAASEMLRVVRDGGRIGMANWTPEGFIGRLFKVLAKHVPPAAGLQAPPLWGTQTHLERLFGVQAAQIRCERRSFNFRYRSAAHWLQIFRDFYGPTHQTFKALVAPQQLALEADITELLEEMNVAGKSSLVIPSDYLEIVITKKGERK